MIQGLGGQFEQLWSCHRDQKTVGEVFKAQKESKTRTKAKTKQKQNNNNNNNKLSVKIWYSRKAC